MRGPRRRATVAVVLSAAYGIGASFTHSFTWAANAVTALPIVAAGTAMIWTRGLGIRWRAGEGEDSEPGTPPPLVRSRIAVTVALVSCVVVFELFNYFSSTRSQHPTLSTLIDLLDSGRPGKAVAFTLWLLLGLVLVTR